MALKFSKGMLNFVAQNGSWKRALKGGKLKFYTGSQPATPETAPSGTLLCTFTDASGAHTAETLATGTVTLNTGAAGSVDTITVNSVSILPAAVPFKTSLTQTAADVATAINNGLSTPEYTATSSGAVVTISAVRGTGAGPNGFVVASTCTTITKTDANMAGGVTAVNGLDFGSASGGVISKSASQTWTGVAAASGTAGWFRYEGSVVDSGTTDSTESQFRIDGSIATSGADINTTPTSITSGATQTISTFAITLPAA